MNEDFSTLTARAERALAAGRDQDFPALLARLETLAGHSGSRWRSIGQLRARCGDMEGSLAALRKAVSLNPRDADTRLALASLARRAGRSTEALDHLEVACRLAPSAPAPAHLMGIMHLEQGLSGAALRWLEQARDAGGDSAELCADLGMTLRAEGRLDEAETCYRSSLEKAPDNEPALRGLAALARLRRRPEEGLALLEPIAPRIRSGGLLAELAGLQAAAGRPEEAVAMLSSRLAGVSDREGQMEMHFRLAQLHDDAGRPEEAMEHLLVANRMKTASFDPRHYAGLVDRLLAVFSRDAMAGFPRAGQGDDRPVFIVGMPRSGTSLVEQILASHSQVYGAGELSDMGLLALSTGSEATEYPESIRSLVAADMDRLAAAYRQRLDRLAPGVPRVTDKMWQNFEFLGFIALLFPEARVIHCTRDPVDTCLSCFFHHFHGEGMAFAYDLGHLGAYYRQYRRIMEHWQAVLPLPILEVKYESLVAAPEPAIRELVAFAGLEWEPSCLRFFDTDRVVRTASFDQVRRPIYRTSIGRARIYARWLEPLIRALESPR